MKNKENMKYFSRRAIDLTGHIYGRLTVLSFVGSTKNRRIWRCQCSCGNIKDVNVGSLRGGTTKSCGCLRTEMLTERAVIHGCCRVGKATKEHKAWCRIRRRILDKNCIDYPNYGGRGIKLLYGSFSEFLNDVGLAPSKSHSIDRIDVNGHYGPGNCRWADFITQE